LLPRPPTPPVGALLARQLLGRSGAARRGSSRLRLPQLDCHRAVQQVLGPVGLLALAPAVAQRSAAAAQAWGYRPTAAGAAAGPPLGTCHVTAGATGPHLVPLAACPAARSGPCTAAWVQPQALPPAAPWRYPAGSPQPCAPASAPAGRCGRSSAPRRSWRTPGCAPRLRRRRPRTREEPQPTGAAQLRPQPCRCLGCWRWRCCCCCCCCCRRCRPGVRRAAPPWPALTPGRLAAPAPATGSPGKEPSKRALLPAAEAQGSSGSAGLCARPCARL
jgi:hypothetical protein